MSLYTFLYDFWIRGNVRIASKRFIVFICTNLNVYSKNTIHFSVLRFTLFIRSWAPSPMNSKPVRPRDFRKEHSNKKSIDVIWSANWFWWWVIVLWILCLSHFLPPYGIQPIRYRWRATVLSCDVRYWSGFHESTGTDACVFAIFKYTTIFEKLFRETRKWSHASFLLSQYCGSELHQYHRSCVKFPSKFVTWHRFSKTHLHFNPPGPTSTTVACRWTRQRAIRLHNPSLCGSPSSNRSHIGR